MRCENFVVRQWQTWNIVVGIVELLEISLAGISLTLPAGIIKIIIHLILWLKIIVYVILWLKYVEKYSRCHMDFFSLLIKACFLWANHNASMEGNYWMFGVPTLNPSVMLASGSCTIDNDRLVCKKKIQLQCTENQEFSCWQSWHHDNSFLSGCWQWTIPMTDFLWQIISQTFHKYCISRARH